ncbi:MAG: RNHCP domain-containing protein, partial [Proteobacteria bacterium]
MSRGSEGSNSFTKRFQRTVEDFTCLNCGKFVEGSGFTNHCPACLWSRHVDFNPGDRLESCRGMMRPFEVEHLSGEYRLTHVCLACGAKRRIKSGKDDDFKALIDL